MANRGNQLHGQKTAVIYARVSTERQEDNASLETQVASSIGRAEAAGYSVGEIVQEIHTGAELWQRKKLDRVRNDIKAGKYQALICHATDRLARDPIHLGIIAEECDRAGAELIFVTEPIDNTIEGQIIRFMRGVAARIEREKIKERTQRGRHARLLSGRLHNWGSELYGYTRNQTEGVREIHPHQAQVVRSIFNWVVKDGLSTHALVRRLNAERIAPPSIGKRIFKDGRTPNWGHGTVRRILAEPAYMGVTLAWRWSREKPNGRVINRPESERIRLPEGVTPPIVTPEVWHATQVRLANQRGDWTRNQNRPDMLRGLVYCAVCGLKCLGQNERGKTRVYRCRSRQTPRGKCGGRRIPSEPCESAVWQKVVAVLEDPNTIAREVERQMKQGGGALEHLRSDADAARREVRKLDALIEKLISRCGDVDDETWKGIQKQIARNREKRATYEAVVTNAERQLAADDAWREGLKEIADYCAIVRDNVSNYSFEERRRVLENLGARVVGNARDWRLEVRLPVAPLFRRQAGLLHRTSC